MLRRLLPSATGLGTALLAVCVHLALTACTTLSPHLDAGSAPIAWQATDFRVMTRTIDGVERTLYTFMLVLEETQGSGITLTQLDYTTHHTVLVHAVLNRQEPVTLLLDMGATRTLLTPDMARRLGSNPEPDGPRSSMVTLGGQQGELPLIRLASLAVGNAVVEDLQVGVFTALPHAPFIDGLLGGDFLKHFTLRLDYAQSRLQLIPPDIPAPSSHLAASPVAAVLSTISTEVIDNHMLVQAMLNHTEPVTLLLDTGTTYTMLTPETARRVGLYPTQQRPSGLLKVVGGQEVQFPLVSVAALAMGDAMAKDLQVGILAAFPGTRPVDGLLGGDFLEHFTLTLDYSGKRLELTPALSGRRGAEDH